VAENDALSFHGPLYEQVHDALRSRILAGEWEPREPLPGEAALARELGVSIGTVRKAMDQLTRDNIVVRERGRGTFVRRNPGGRLGSPFGLCDRSGQRLMPDITVTGFERAIATEAEREALDISGGYRGQQTVYRIHREWKADDKLLCQETLAVEEVRFPRLGQHKSLDCETLFEVYVKSFRTRVDRIEWEIGGKSGASNNADDVVLLIKRRAFDDRATPIELCEQRVYLLNCQVQLNR
jgi:GntR family transcriptional regulator